MHWNGIPDRILHWVDEARNSWEIFVLVYDLCYSRKSNCIQGGFPMSKILIAENDMNLHAKWFEELQTRELYEILKARSKVFMVEQKICYLDMDDVDYESFHCFYMRNGKVAAYLRAYYDENDKNAVHIGRVLTLHHGNGMGRSLMEQSMKEIKEKMKCQKILLDAQTHAIGFYEKLGFIVTSDEFLEAGVPHVKMKKEFGTTEA
jgi:ElaA protein